jgi:hypothetical protein
MADEWTLDDFAREHRPAQATARVCFRQDLWNRHAALDAELSKAITTDSTENRDPESPALAAALQELEAEIEASEKAFVFESIGKRRWFALLAEHPPTPEQREEGNDHNPATFPQAAMAACAIDPTMTVETAEAMADRLNLSQWNRLWAAVLTANLAGGEAPKSALATVVAQQLGRFSTTAPPAESLEASS